jgi:single-stranded DNA-binding protein
VGVAQMERNSIEFTGAIERLREIPTKSGAQMAKWFLKVGEHRFQCVAFGNLATTVLVAGEGKEIGVVGEAAINSWKTEDGAWRNDFQVTAWAVEIDGIITAFEKASKVLQEPSKSEQNTDEFDYRGGPF